MSLAIVKDEVQAKREAEKPKAVIEARQDSACPSQTSQDD